MESRAGTHRVTLGTSFGDLKVDEMHAVAPAREPGCAYAGAASDVEHHGRRRWQLTLQQLARAKQLEAVMAKPERRCPSPAAHSA
jgi:hypothetical protein